MSFTKFLRMSVFHFFVILYTLSVVIDVSCNAACEDCCNDCALDVACMEGFTSKSRYNEYRTEKIYSRQETYLEETGTYVGNQPISVKKTRDVYEYKRKPGYVDEKPNIVAPCIPVLRILETGLVIGSTVHAFTDKDLGLAYRLGVAGGFFSSLNTVVNGCVSYWGEVVTKKVSAASRAARSCCDLINTTCIITAAALLKTQENSQDPDPQVMLSCKALLTTSAVLSGINILRCSLSGAALQAAGSDTFYIERK